MIERRIELPLLRLAQLAAIPESYGPTTTSDSAWPVEPVVRQREVDVGRLARPDVLEDRRRRAEDQRRGDQRLVRAVGDRALDVAVGELQRRRDLGGGALASARIVRSDPNPTLRSRTRDGSPWSTSSSAVPAAGHVAVHRRRRAGRRPGRAAGTSPSTGLKIPRYDWAVAASVPGAPRDDRHLVDDHVRSRGAPPRSRTTRP